MQYIYIFIGGALGALLRYAFSTLNDSSGFPLPFIVNLLGAF